MSLESKCDHCGAYVKGLVCEYCGAYHKTNHDADIELKALDEYHIYLQKSDKEQDRAKILEHGFLPQHQAVLIEAGVRCIPLVKTEISKDAKAAQLRLEAIVIKLKLMPSDAAIEQAVTEFQIKIDEAKTYERNFDRGMLVGCVIFLLSCGGGIGGFIYLGI
ncbi:hypothetical protein QUF64_09950 [Anaerolineales bacterium HSG6]|nr:hypothetical protein [Anaerolineales bacterium HSG6]